MKRKIKPSNEVVISDLLKTLKMINDTPMGYQDVCWSLASGAIAKHNAAAGQKRKKPLHVNTKDKTEPRSMHCDWAAMKEETYWDKTDGVAELRGRLERIRELFEGATQPPNNYSGSFQYLDIT